MIFLVFSIILYLACASVVLRLKRRKRFFLRLGVSTAVYFALAYCIQRFMRYFYFGWFNASFLIVDLLCMGVILLCFKTNFFSALFYSSIGYTIEHISSRLLYVFSSLVGIDFRWRFWMRLAFGVATVAVIYFLIIKREQQSIVRGSSLLPKTSTVIVSLISVVFICVLSLYADRIIFRTNELLINLYSLGCGTLLIMVQFDVFNRSKMQEDKDVVSRVMAMAQEQYTMSQENINMINIKCHDLKHRIDLLRNSDCDDREEQLNELERLLKNYEATFRTGNGALDVVLTSKSLLCNELNIKLLPLIDGGAVSGMKNEDIYSLFGNILDNAIEYLKTVEDKNLREIGLRITRKNNLLVIHTENYCDTPLKFKGGLPLTTKQDTENHGFGMASIKYIVNKYNGTLSVGQDDDVFVLNIIIPM